MAYLDDLLAREERVLLQARRHPLFMVLHAGPWVLLTLVLWLLAALAVWQIPDVAGVDVGLILGLALFAGSSVPLLIGLYRFLHWSKERYVITNFRILQIEGLVNRRALDSALEKVNDVVMTQSLFGRIFNFGTINIVTGSDAAINDIDGVARPFDFKRALLEAKMEFNSIQYPPRAAAAEAAEVAGDASRHSARTDQLPPVDAGDDPSRAVIALTELRNAGVITDAEFSEKLRRLTKSG